MKNIKIFFLLFIVLGCTDKASNIFDDITDRGASVFFETKLNPLHDILGVNDNVVDIKLIDYSGNAISNSIAILKEDGTLTESVAETVVPGNLIIKRQAVIDALGLTNVEELPPSVTFISTVTTKNGTIISGLQSNFDTTLGMVTGGNIHYDGIADISTQAMRFSITMFQLIKPNEETSFLITSTNDDVEEVLALNGESGPVGRMSRTSSDLELGELSSGQGLMAIGLKFNFIGLPQGANVTEASIQFTTDATGSNPVEMTIFGEASANPSEFTSATKNITNRNLTSAKEVWNIAPWLRTGDRGSAQRTVDISSIITEIVGSNDWVPGNSIVIIMKPTGNTLNVTSTSGGREAETYPESNDGVAELFLKYN